MTCHCGQSLKTAGIGFAGPVPGQDRELVCPIGRLPDLGRHETSRLSCARPGRTREPENIAKSSSCRIGLESSETRDGAFQPALQALWNRQTLSVVQFPVSLQRQQKGADRVERDAFIIFTHYLNERILSFVDRAQCELSQTHDVRVIGYFPDRSMIPPNFLKFPMTVACTPADLKELQFPGVAEVDDYNIIPGDADMPILWFAKRNPNYATLWVFEGDVDYTGSLRELVEHLRQSKADLLLTRLEAARPEWPHFRNTVLPPGWPDPKESRLCGFLPVYRTSRRLINAVSAFYSSGGRGHFEWVWPQVAERYGFEYRDLLDFPLNGRSLYTRGPEYRSRSLGTFRYRPAIHRPGRRRNTLWHPVKDRPVDLIRELIVQPVSRRLSETFATVVPGAQRKSEVPVRDGSRPSGNR